MKYNLLISGFLCFGLGMTSCSDSFLDVSSKTESTTGTFYKDEQDAYRALIGCYDGWRQTSSAMGISFYVGAEIMSGECFGGTGNGDARNYQVIDRFDISQSPADLNLYETDWKNYYAGVYRCNELISREEQVKWKDENSKRGTYMGECRAIRALLYFDMVRLWGNIPLLDTPTSENVPQADPKDVYNLIISDLKYAVENIPADAYPKANSAQNDGHITKYAAEALLARVYLFYTGYYGVEPEGLTKNDALAAVEDVIASGEYSLVPEFKNLWPAASGGIAEIGDMTTLYGTYAGDGNSETVLAMKFTSSQDYDGNNDSNRWQVMVGMRSLNSAPYGKGWGAMTVNPKFVAEFGAGDTRRQASIIDLAAEGITELKDFNTSYKDQREYTGYTVKKYSPLCFADGTSASKEDGSGDFQTQNHQDYVIIRYSDVLLMAAELGSPNAQDYFDQVRKRAYTSEGQLSPNYSSLNATKENILKERRLEFAFESINYWDVLRQGIDYAANHLAVTDQAVESGGNPDVVNISADRIRATQGLSQIPYNQITLSNGVLKQNPGW
ncbi:RagB/SusD family nutrient uptake outer membrane protein [uncultured Bacteroides sp.]|uniref:RagB/SusD family nutrient uptake outer membrane protein n=1 Tax=uncultured Bacteroides sp. TaxID=162156 RepID=UPI0026040F9E|nr:RagB/SusD family nutrient uptake outer membrane protein [uncultured Bacteroides sp.]